MQLNDYLKLIKKEKRPFIVNLGCGKTKPYGHFGVDKRKFDGVDFVADLGKDKFPFKNNSVDEIYSVHLFEHLYPEELFFCIDECFRVIKPTGFMHVCVPIAGTKAWYAHPDHKIHFTKDTFGFFLPPADKDPHGYLKGFWHLDFKDCENDEVVEVDFYPNKKGIEKYEYREIK